MGKSCSFGLQYVFCTMSSLNKGDVHNCRLYVTIEIDTRVCVQVTPPPFGCLFIDFSDDTLTIHGMLKIGN